MHLTGYPKFTMDMLRRYHSPNFIESLATGHPEIEQEAGIELTTGLLGQGIANAVGFAIANKHIEARFTKPGYEDLFSNRVYCMVGDGCLQEGIGQEGASRRYGAKMPPRCSSPAHVTSMIIQPSPQLVTWVSTILW